MGGVDRGDQLHGYYNYKISCKMNHDTGQFKISEIVNIFWIKRNICLTKMLKNTLIHTYMTSPEIQVYKEP